MISDHTLDEPAVDDDLSLKAEDLDSLAEKAERCRRLAAGISDRQAADVLRVMANQYENVALRLRP